MTCTAAGHRMQPIAIQAILLLAAALPACDAPVTLGYKAQAIINGTVDEKDPAVVLVIMQNGSSSDVCTGTIVSPHVVLTAAHCANRDLVDPSYTWYIYYGNNIRATNGSEDIARVKALRSHPQFDINQPELGYDVGAVITTTPLAAAPLPMNRTALGAETVGREARVIGFGNTKPGVVTSNGTRMQALATVENVDKMMIGYSSEAALACTGDSGGPLLLTIDGQEVVAGVHSYLAGDIATCNGPDWDVRVDVFASSFVDPIIAEFDPTFVQPDLGHNVSDLASTSGTDAESPPAAPGAGCTIASSAHARQQPRAFEVIIAALLLALLMRGGTRAKNLSIRRQ